MSSLERAEGPKGAGIAGAFTDCLAVEAEAFEALGFNGCARGALSGPGFGEQVAGGLRTRFESAGAFCGYFLREGSIFAHAGNVFFWPGRSMAKKEPGGEAGLWLAGGRDLSLPRVGRGFVLGSLVRFGLDALAVHPAFLWREQGLADGGRQLML